MRSIIDRVSGIRTRKRWRPTSLLRQPRSHNQAEEFDDPQLRVRADRSLIKLIGDGSEFQSLPWHAPQQKSLPSQSCSAQGLRGSFVDFRSAAVLLGPQYGFPCSRVGVAWEHLFIQARSASKGIRGDRTSRAEHYCSRPYFQARTCVIKRRLLFTRADKSSHS